MPATSTCVRSVSASRLTKEAAPQQLIVIFSVTRRSEEHTSELQSQSNLVCRLLLEKKKHIHDDHPREQHRLHDDLQQATQPTPPQQPHPFHHTPDRHCQQSDYALYAPLSKRCATHN